MTEHITAPLGEIHPPYNWAVPSEAARLAIVPEGPFLLYAHCLQTNTTPATVWRLMQVSPAVWEQVGVAEVTWTDVQDKPTTFPPEAHTHPDTGYQLTNLLLQDPGTSHLAADGILISHMWSSGVVNGGAATDNGDGTLTIAAGEVCIRTAASGHSAMWVQPFAQTTVTPADGALSFVRVVFNGVGLPATIDVTTDFTTVNCQNICHTHRVVREGLDLHVVDSRYQSVDANRQFRVRSHRTKLFEAEAGGLQIAGLASLGVSTTAGAVWYALRQQSIIGFTTTTAGTANANVFRRYHETSTPGVFTTALDQKAGTAQYNNAGTLTNLAANRFGTWYWYLIVGDTPHLAAVVGKVSHNSLAAAQAEAVPTVLPASLAGNGILIGQTVVQGTTTVWASVSSAFTTAFALSASANHSTQSGLGNNDHTQYDLQDAPVTALGTLATSATIALVAQSRVYTATTNGNTTIAFSGVPASGFERSIQLRLIVTGTDTVTFTGALYDGGVTPSYSGGGKRDDLEIHFVGSSFDIKVSGKDVK